jgi:lysophospholipase L1-like esterase
MQEKVLFFGDSVTDASRNRELYDDLGLGFLPKLQKKHPNISFLNRGNSGDKTRDLIFRIDNDCLKINPDLCFVWIGINDAWAPHLHQYVFDFNQFEIDFNELMHILTNQFNSVSLHLILPFYFEIGHIDKSTALDIDRVCETIKQISKTYNIKYLDLHDDMYLALKLYKSSDILPDGVHPSPLGYDIISNAIESYGLKNNLW